MYKRILNLPKNQSFLLLGPRQTGKTTLLKKLFPRAYWIDFLKSEIYRRYAAYPEALRQEVISDPTIKQVVIDEVQRLPHVLDEVHWLIENKKVMFGLCGSSARKLKRQGVNRLGGRALRYELSGLTSKEVGKTFDLKRMLNYGYLPSIYLHKHPQKALETYVSDYLKEEIAQEALVKKLLPFSQFLEKAALSDTEMVQYSNFARDCGVSDNTIREYFEILQDTLIGQWVHGYRKRLKRRHIFKPKFYFADVGVVNFLAKRKSLQPKSFGWGKAFENWVFHELICLKKYKSLFDDIFYWRLSNGSGEVDFIIDDMRLAIEAKAVEFVHSDHLKGLRQLSRECPIHKKVIISLDQKKRQTTDDILILPYQNFTKEIEELLT